ncbi:MAG: hypothetical protein NDF53_01725 [archaeon GB-1867-097]|nr:hypothetical protein [Candidatus Verstraetearchaeota archaeon]MCS7373950.1 hypothetical protein [Candidatus Culexmicrobium thermophilum]MCS7384436.1 hypothetical protein [Candidatus Culexmicrobium thermophilum]RLE57537.1 MAG: hypothetical protein DRJ30_00265 [Candidatus Verstraetearchaeota archaeon]HDO20016.1 hypothetical protein [Candidatus Bathyarchaeota archaeon]
MITRKITYFERCGRRNTEETLRLAKERADELGVRDVVVASTTGETGVKACEIFKGFNVVVVTHSVGFRSPGINEFEEENRRRILEMGGRIFTGTHALSAVERSVRRQLSTWLPLELMANTLRIFGEGIKVAVEIAVMAADAGLIPIDGEVIAIGGTGRGADTAVVLKPAHSTNFFDLEIREIICKPRRIIRS